MRGIKNIKKPILLAVACFVVLFISFFANIFGTGLSDKWFSDFQQRDSALIVQKTAECKDISDYDGPIMPQTPQDYAQFSKVGMCSTDITKPYDSQYGLQARLVAFFAPSGNQLGSYFKLVEIMLSAIMAVVFTLFLFRTVNIFNIKVAAVVFVLIAISPWIVGYARNMYWASFMMFVPFIFSFVTYQWFKTRQKMPLFYGLLGLFFLIKLLDGYEHVSTILMSAFVPIIFFEVGMYSKRLIDLWKPAVLIVSVGVVVLVLALVINVASLTSYYGSTQQALSKVAARAESRSTGLADMQPYVISGFSETLPDTYQFIDQFYDLDQLRDGKAHPLKYAVLSALNYALLPAISLPVIIREPLSDILQSIAFLAVVAFFMLSFMKNNNRRTTAMIRALKYCYWISLLGAISWLVLMPGHAYPHAHLNAIIFYIPFLLICYVIIGMSIDDYLCKMKKVK